MQTNLPVLTNTTVPAHLAAFVGAPSAAMQAAMTGMSSGRALRLVANQGRFRIKDGAAETVLPDLFLDIVIVGAVAGVTKSYYSTAFKPGDEKENKQPDCASLLGDVPDATALHKQSSNCASCPQNQWGSEVANGKEIKACSDYRRVALVSADDPETVYQANIPPASIKNWTKYVKDLAIRGVDIAIVKTRISLVEHMWTFQFAGYVDAMQHAAVQQLLGSAIVTDVLGLTGRAPALPVSVPAPAAPAAARQAGIDGTHSAPHLGGVSQVVAPAPAPAPVADTPAPSRGFGKKGAAAQAPAPAPVAVPTANVQVAAASSGLDALASELGALLNAPASV